MLKFFKYAPYVTALIDNLSKDQNITIYIFAEIYKALKYELN